MIARAPCSQPPCVSLHAACREAVPGCPGPSVHFGLFSLDFAPGSLSVQCYIVKNKTVQTPRRPYDRERMDRELQVIGKYGLRNKREVWRAQLALSTIRRKARSLLVMDEKAPKRIFEGTALLRRLARYGVIADANTKLDALLSLTIDAFLDRRLQTRVLKAGSAKSMHHARCLILQRHVVIGKRVCNSPSLMVRVDTEKHIGLDPRSSLAGGKPGRHARKSAAKADE